MFTQHMYPAPPNPMPLKASSYIPQGSVQKIFIPPVVQVNSLGQIPSSMMQKQTVIHNPTKGVTKATQVAKVPQLAQPKPAIRFINESSGAKNTRESFKVVSAKDSTSQPDCNVPNNSASTSKVLSREGLTNSQKQFAQTFPVKQQLSFSPTKAEKTCSRVKESSRSPSEKPPSNRLSSGGKRQQSQEPVVRRTPEKARPVLISAERSPIIIEPFQCKRLYTSKHQTNIIEEQNEDEQLQGQGMENDFKEDTLSDERRRRKSITLFEMHQDFIENEMLEQLRQRTLDDDSEEEESEIKVMQMKETIERLSSQPSEVLLKAQRMKVLVNGHHDEREFYVDVGQIPQHWRLKKLAHILNKMYYEQQGEKLGSGHSELQHPVLSILIGRVHTRRLDPNMRMFELIDLAVSGIMGGDNLIVLEDT